MNRIIVIADDITGAAEIAGIAHRYGLRTTLSISPSSPLGGNEGGFDGEGSADVIVIATDARSYGPEEAARMTKDVVSGIFPNHPPQGGTRGDDFILFRKTDSALRGNVKEELDAILSSPLGRNEGGRGFLYMPANPSKGRIIRDGVYYIASPPGGNEGGFIPLHETDFSFDPEFPAWSSRIEERFPGLEYANAETKADVDRAVEKALAEGKLLAGAADLFCSLVEHTFGLRSASVEPFKGLPRDASLLVVQGSTQSKDFDLGIPIETMPDDVFYERAEPSSWTPTTPTTPPQPSPKGREKETRKIESPSLEGRAGVGSGLSGLVLTIGSKEVRPGKAAAVYLRNAMAEVTCTVFSRYKFDELIIEGGATAFAILSRLPYSAFNITDEIAPGVVRLQPVGHPDVHITMKPGSYSWGKLFQ